MNGIHDLGGMHGLGPVVPEPNEPVFHEPWEGRAFALFAGTFVFAGYTVDEFRHAIEKIEPAHYLESSYYEHWLHAFEEVADKARLRQPRRARCPGRKAAGGGQ